MPMVGYRSSLPTIGLRDSAGRGSTASRSGAGDIRFKRDYPDLTRVAFLHVEPHVDLEYRVVTQEPLVVLMPSDHRLTASIAGEARASPFPA